MLAFVAAAGGCSLSGPTLEVIVTDPAGTPIAGASVYPVSPSFNGPPKLTNAAGTATISAKMIQNVEWVGVRADGFAPRQLAVSTGSPLRATLSPLGDGDRETAEETFKKIEEAIEHANTISVRMIYQRGDSVLGKVDEEEQNQKIGCTMLLKEGNKINISAQRSWIFTGPTDLSVISDGTRMHVTDALGITKSGESPKGLTAGFRTILSRVGYFGSQHHIPRGPTLAKDAEPDLKKFLEEDLKQVFMASSFKAGGEKNQPWIKYVLRVRDEDAAQVTLWYDPKIFKPLKRHVSFSEPDLNFTITHTETYEEFTLNADIPDEKFKLPEK